MKTISPELALHLEGEVTTLATCWKLTRRDETVMGFTEHDKALIIEGVTYEAASGFTRSAINTQADLSADNLDLEGMLSSTSITEPDIMAGLYDFAEIEIFMVNYADLSQGKLKLRRGWLGEVSLNRQKFVAEVRGLMQALSQQIGALYSPACRANLGDARCKVNMAGFTVTGTVTAVTDNQNFKDSAREEEAGYFNFGNITFTSGNNAGLSMEVKTYSPGIIELVFAMPYSVQVGDAYTMQAGCDKTLGTCKGRFNNVLNFRGEPHVPGTDAMLQTSTTRPRG